MLTEWARPFPLTVQAATFPFRTRLHWNHLHQASPLKLWIKADQLTANSDWKGIVTKGNSSWRLQGRPGQKRLTLARPVSPNGDLYGSRNVNDGQWHHVAAYMMGRTCSSMWTARWMYRSRPRVRLPRTAIRCALERMRGRTDDFFQRVGRRGIPLHRALSASEIQTIIHAGAGGKCLLLLCQHSLPQPSESDVIVGRTATFSVTASWRQPLSYQWNFNGTNISRGDKHHVNTDQCAIESGGQLCGAGDQCLWFSPQFQCGVDSESVPLAVGACGMMDWWPAEGNANDSSGAITARW